MNPLQPLATNTVVDPPTLLVLSESGQGADRRETPRFAVDAEVRFIRCKPGISELITGEVHDASLKGMRAVLDQPVRKGEQLQIEVRTPQHGQFQIEVQIMWTEVGVDGRYITGCEFCSILTLKQRAHLQRLAEASIQSLHRTAV